MSEPSLKQRTIGALLWNLLDRMGQQVLLFIVGVLVANILSVEDYALVGMLAIFSAIANIVLDSGFSAALIRKQDATETDYNSVFYLNIFISVCLYLLLFVCSPLIAGFFNQPLLTDLARVIFLALPFNSLSLIQTTLLNKQVSFKILTKINLIALTASGIGSLAMAYGGMGVWTLAWQPVILAFLRTVLLWFFNKWRPQLLFSISHIKELFGFSSNLLLAGLVNSIFTNIYSVAIGKLYPPVQLGYYSQGNKFSLMVISSVYSSLQTATYPIFSHIQNDKERSLRSYRKTIRFTAFLTFPLMTGMVSVYRTDTESGMDGLCAFFPTDLSGRNLHHSEYRQPKLCQSAGALGPYLQTGNSTYPADYSLPGSQPETKRAYHGSLSGTYPDIDLPDQYRCHRKGRRV